LQQATAPRVIVRVLAEMVRQTGNASREESYLNFRRAAIA